MDVNLDRRVKIEKKSVTREPKFNSAVTTWVPHVEVWAEVVDALPSRSESVRQGLNQARNQTRIRIRYLEGIDSTMRIRYRDRTLQIVGGPAELGRKEYLELMCEEYTTAGDA